jgi:hypothetical protein
VSVVRNLKKDGLDKTRHHDPISETDLKTIRESFDTSSPTGLLHKVWFDLTLGFARRGNENMSELKSNTFRISVDETGIEFIEKVNSEITKNHRGDLKDGVECKTRIYATGSEFCPVESFKMYMRRLNSENHCFFQGVRKRVTLDDEVWYTSRPMGKTMIGNFMKVISKRAGLTKMYTNHCVRATSVTLLSHAGVETREICKITGHKNDQSLKSYSTESSANQKRAYSAILQGHSHAHDDKLSHTTALSSAPSHESSFQNFFVNSNTNNSAESAQGMFNMPYSNNQNITVNNYFCKP